MQTTAKKSPKFNKQITHVDDMMIHNLVKYLVQTRIDISQMNSNLDKIFYKIVYNHIIYMCDFLMNLDNFFVMVYTGFYEGCGFH